MISVAIPMDKMPLSLTMNINHLLNPQIFTERLLCARYWGRDWKKVKNRTDISLVSENL